MPTHRELFYRKYNIPLSKSLSLEEIADIAKVPLKALEEIFKRGEGAWGNNLASVRLASNFAKNPNSISTGLYTFKIPVKPVAANKVTATPVGAIGISLNGVPFYNQYAGPNQPLAGEMTSFDQYYGHPQAQGGFHYHVEP